jgi:hypothetical protein
MQQQHRGQIRKRETDVDMATMGTPPPLDETETEMERCLSPRKRFKTHHHHQRGAKTESERGAKTESERGAKTESERGAKTELMAEEKAPVESEGTKPKAEGTKPKAEGEEKVWELRVRREFVRGNILHHWVEVYGTQWLQRATRLDLSGLTRYSPLTAMEVFDAFEDAKVYNFPHLRHIHMGPTTWTLHDMEFRLKRMLTVCPNLETLDLSQICRDASEIPPRHRLRYHYHPVSRWPEGLTNLPYEELGAVETLVLHPLMSWGEVLPVVARSTKLKNLTFTVPMALAYDPVEGTPGNATVTYDRNGEDYEHNYCRDRACVACATTVFPDCHPLQAKQKLLEVGRQARAHLSWRGLAFAYSLKKNPHSRLESVTLQYFDPYLLASNFDLQLDGEILSRNQCYLYNECLSNILAWKEAEYQPALGPVSKRSNKQAQQENPNSLDVGEDTNCISIRCRNDYFPPGTKPFACPPQRSLLDQHEYQNDDTYSV